MKWISTNIKEVTTPNPVYFDPEKSRICTRICEVLFIDCFPELESKSYKRIVKGEWVRKELDYNISGIDSAFDKELLFLYEKNDSNIVFTSNNRFINGVIHFTNYEHPNVYSNIYHNLNMFEKNLRNHLFEFDLSDNDFIEYLETYELRKTKKQNRIDWIKKRISELKEGADKRPFENTFLSELLDFSVSKFHSTKTRQKLGTSFLKEQHDVNGEKLNTGQIIKKLRNFIMHHDNISGESVFTPHNFSTFKSFFTSVVVFKEAYKEFREIRIKVKLPHLVNTNRHRLETIEKLDNSEITKYFYN